MRGSYLGLVSSVHEYIACVHAYSIVYMYAYTTCTLVHDSVHMVANGAIVYSSGYRYTSGEVASSVQA